MVRSSWVRVMMWGGIISGTLDLLYAVPFYSWRGARPGSVLQAIASGLLGPKSFRGGAPTIVLGFLLEYAITFGATLVYYGASRKLTFLLRQPVVCGALYGIAIYYFMHLIVLPLSAAPRFRPSTLTFFTDMLVHMFLIGLPIALLTKRYGENSLRPAMLKS